MNVNKITPDKAIEMLKQGNERFVNGHTVKRDMLALVEQTSKGQFPYAAVVSCLDSRIPPEIVFDQGIGDLFVARVAGNFVNDDILGLLTATLANINPAVEEVKGDYTPRSSKNTKFVQAVTEMNIQLTMQKLRKRSVVLREMLDKGEIAMVGAMYDVSTGEVVFGK